MSTDARLQERPISQTILPRLRRTQELPALSFSHVPARSCRYTALSLHAPDSHRARYAGSCLSGGSAARECCSEQARKLTEPPPGCDFGATDEPVKATAWKNVIFERNGRSHLCGPIYPTEQVAREDGIKALEHLALVLGDDINRRIQFHDGFWAPASDIHYFIQIRGSRCKSNSIGESLAWRWFGLF